MDMSRTEDHSEMPQAIVHRNILDRAAEDHDASMEEIADDVSGASIDLVERVLEKYGDPSEAETSSSATDGGESKASETVPAESDDEVDSEADGQDERSDVEPGDSDEQSDVEPGNSDEQSEQPDPEIDVDELSEKQRKTLRLVEEHPEATQAELAERFGVTPSAINRRLNDIPGFEWNDRSEIASEIVDSTERTGERGEAQQRADRDPDAENDEHRLEDTAAEVDDAPSTASGAAATNHEVRNATDGGATPPVERSIEELQQRTMEIERELEQSAVDGEGLDPELLYKAMRACMNSDQITEEEELDILRKLAY